ncbi:MAG: hypothetical protein M3O71_21630 [Bacteroidota bacterium]|nr:hypothetical protein [Bacteroidota bacterium]
MKKILLSTIILFSFAVSIILFEISCKKTANAQSSFILFPATTSKLGGVIPDGTTISVDATGKISTMSNNSLQQQNKILYGTYGSTDATNAIWTANYDGSNAEKLNITLPTGLAIDIESLAISPDHKTIFFSVYTPALNSGGYFIYACNTDGSNTHKIIAGSANGNTIGIAY